MRDRSRQIGFSQRIRLEWLERTAYLVLAGNDNESINTALAEFLQDKLSIGGKAQRGNREKAITILMKIWSNVPSELTSLRDSGLSLFKSLPRDVHIAIHWGMAMAVYPFWGAVASSTGRLLRLQGTASASQVQRRLREKYGERETVSRAARRVLRAFVDWDVLEETDEKGIYRSRRPRKIEDPRLVSWLIEACLVASTDLSGTLTSLIGSPALFPFELRSLAANELGRNDRLEVVNHGLGGELVVLRGQATRK